MYKMLSLTHCKKILQSFLRLLPQLFLFELAFKVLSLFLFIPAGKELIVMMLEIAGDTSLYNYHMLQILFSFPGIAAIILILCLSAFLAYFEFSLIFIALYQSYTGSSFSLKDTLKTLRLCPAWKFRISLQENCLNGGMETLFWIWAIL